MCDYRFTRFCFYIQTVLLSLGILFQDLDYITFEFIYGSIIFIIVNILESIYGKND